ncbi:hypothetical protein BYT27DRAFT_7255788 [Phlegmacium glaucopus]|nr:hypothetical protein BYT27DRAFT_7255788 [Phlegmacium glaucopus]
MSSNTKTQASMVDTEIGHCTLKRVEACEAASITWLSESLDENNWTIWQEHIYHVFKVCGVLLSHDYEHWEFNDSYAQCLITNNIAANQMLNVTGLPTAHKMWTSSEAVHEAQGHQYTIALMHALFGTCAEEGDNIIEHLNKLQEMWEKLNILNNENFHVLDAQFKTIIASSLPELWDTFMDPYIGGQKTATNKTQRRLF